jgi:hypothetical protein
MNAEETAAGTEGPQPQEHVLCTVGDAEAHIELAWSQPDAKRPRVMHVNEAADVRMAEVHGDVC